MYIHEHILVEGQSCLLGALHCSLILLQGLHAQLASTHDDAHNDGGQGPVADATLWMVQLAWSGAVPKTAMCALLAGRLKTLLCASMQTLRHLAAIADTRARIRASSHPRNARQSKFEHTRMKQRLCKCRAMRFSGCSASAEMDIRSAGVRLACHWQDARTCCDRSLARRGAGRYQVATPCTDPFRRRDQQDLHANTLDPSIRSSTN